MPTDNLTEAIQLIEQGQHEQAQPLLQALIQANPQDLTAWSWFVRSCRTPEKRLQALELSLKFNPGNPQILEAIQKLRGKLSPPPPPPVPEPDPFAYTPYDEAPLSDPYAYTPLDTPAPDPYAYAAFAAPAAVSETTALGASDEFKSLDESPGRPFIWYDVWLKALTQPNIDLYTALLRDPLASPGRAYWWVFLTGMITGLFVLINLSLSPQIVEAINELEREQNLKDFGTIMAVVMIVLVPLQAAFSVLGLMLGAAIYDLLAKLFGGNGNFSRTAYLMGAWTAPFSIITSILSIIPLVSCLNIPLAFYSFRLSIISIQAAHRMNGGRATIVILIPTLLILMLFCIVFVAGGSALMDALRQYSR